MSLKRRPPSSLESQGDPPSSLESQGDLEDAPDSSAAATDTLLRQIAAVTDAAISEAVPLLPLTPGEVIERRFVIERRIGRGGMGTVYRAVDRATGRPAAIKAMARQSPSVAERFLREAIVLAELSHPRIVRYVAHGVTEQGQPYLAMDWLEGEDLGARLARSPLSPSESLLLVRRASEGLAASHARGVVHRDVKPSNLFLVDRDPSAIKVIDFGVARIPVGESRVTVPGTALGTAGYMAPEQASGATDVDARADVYGLGCVLFECLTGRPPLVGRPAALLAKVLREEPPRPSTLNPELNEEADALLARLLAKDRERRPKDGQELLCLLDGVVSLLR